jgi:hypothetical protein
MWDHAVHQMIRIPCVVQHSDPGAMDEYGDHPVAMVTETNERCHLNQSTRSETGEVEVERYMMYFLPSTIIDGNDAVIVQGMTLQIIGNPWVVTDPVTGWSTHIEATAVRRQ